MMDRTDLSEQELRHAQSCGFDGENCPDGRYLPDIPKVMNWAMTLLVLGVIPPFFVFVGNIFSGSAVASGVGFPVNNYIAVLLSIGFIILAVIVLNGCRWTRRVILVVIVAFDFIIVFRSIIGSGHYFGPIDEPQAGIVSGVFLALVWVVVLSGAGLVLLYLPASSEYIARSEAYNAYIDKRDADRLTQ